ncbi:CotS family spore coat protein [Chengkuizengella axinellae]|uniref:CotS family spore coat protein n=1 Tax=Chengkuizengella axinellae TaxID=3064388 RepID=A0ABT9J441_9BACL|nr:CotS family spore coat protein [Chengkuizengella sp. 2205SS18-9]MDP5276415.1 CotS family spore coat protein [Chengkuizengella sp. 2205SS18-9]
MDQENNQENHLKRVLQLYPFDVGEVHLLESRSGRTTWEVSTDQGIKILKQAHMKPRRMLFIAGAHNDLVQKGIPITPIHKTKNGAICIGAEDHAYVLYDHIKGNEMIYYNKEQMKKVFDFAGKFHHASKGYVPAAESKTRSRLNKWHKLFRWKLQELEGHKMLAQTYPDEPFSVLFLEYADKMLERGRNALKELDEGPYEQWIKQSIEDKSYCQQDFTLARFTEVNSEPFMKELHSITYDLPSRDLRILLNKMMKKLSVWDTDFVIELLRSYDHSYPLTRDQYSVLWTDLKFPHLFCAIVHKYFLSQKRSWGDEKYIWALQNIIAVEDSKEQFLNELSEITEAIKEGERGEKAEQ